MVIFAEFKNWYPGTLTCVLIGIASIALSQQYGMPTMILAVLLGMALHNLSSASSLQTGVDWSAHTLLYIGVALLGFRIDLNILFGSGITIPAIAISLVAATMLLGYWINLKLVGDKGFAVLLASGVAICGISAAAAVYCLFPQNKERDGQLALTIGGITVLSALAMILYPALLPFLELSEHRAGIFLGGTIHNVSQAIGAGYAVSSETGDMATLVKLIRVSLLLPIIVIIGNLFSQKSGKSELGWKTYFPPFLIVFFLLAVIVFLGWIPDQVALAGNKLAEFFLIVSLVAIGMKTDMRQIMSIGPRPIWALGISTGLIAILAIVILVFLPTQMI